MKLSLRKNATYAVLVFLVCIPIFSLPEIAQCNAPEAPTFPLRIIWAGGDEIHEREFDYNNFKEDTILKITHPDQATNPKLLLESWNGRRIDKLIHEANMAVKDQTTITFIAPNNYATSMEFSDAKAFGAMSATSRDGKIIPWTAGGPHLIFDIARKNFPEWLKRPGFWVWTLTAIIVGDIPASLQIINDRGEKKWVRMSEFDRDATKKIFKRYFPRGERKSGFPTTVAVPSTLVPLDSFLTRQKIRCSNGKVKAISFGGAPTAIKEESINKMVILYKWEDKGIPAQYGGPIQLCTTDELSNCIYHLKGFRCDPQ